MTIKKYPLSSIQKVRKYLLQSLALPDTEQAEGYSETDEMPEPESLDDLSGIFTFGGTPLAQNPPTMIQDEWFISTVNPGACLIKLPGLQIKSEYRLVSYLFRTQGNGMGVVWAVPEAFSTTTDLEQALSNQPTMTQMPRPKQALDDFMGAIVGDRSPSSFLMASILRRELQEFGVVGDRQNWSRHELIDAVPSGEWNWRTAQPRDLWPKVKILEDGQAAVEFFTYCHTTPKTLYRHLDQYATDSYLSRSLDNALAVKK